MKKFTLDYIFKNTKTKYELKLFQQSKINWLEKKIFDKGGKPYIKCLATDKDRPAKPEEIVRQLWIKKLLDDYHYPKDRIDAGRAVQTGAGFSDKETDIVMIL